MNRDRWRLAIAVMAVAILGAAIGYLIGFSQPVVLEAATLLGGHG